MNDKIVTRRGFLGGLAAAAACLAGGTSLLAMAVRREQPDVWSSGCNPIDDIRKVRDTAMKRYAHDGPFIVGYAILGKFSDRQGGGFVPRAGNANANPLPRLRIEADGVDVTCRCFAYDVDARTVTLFDVEPTIDGRTEDGLILYRLIEAPARAVPFHRLSVFPRYPDDADSMFVQMELLYGPMPQMKGYTYTRKFQFIATSKTQKEDVEAKLLKHVNDSSWLPFVVYK